VRAAVNTTVLIETLTAFSKINKYKSNCIQFFYRFSIPNFFIAYFLYTRSINMYTDMKKQRRDEFICRFYEHVDGLTNAEVTNIRPAAEDWGFTIDELDVIIDYFRLKGYVKTATGNRYHLGLEPEGHDYVKGIDCSEHF